MVVDVISGKASRLMARTGGSEGRSVGHVDTKVANRLGKGSTRFGRWLSRSSNDGREGAMF